MNDQEMFESLVSLLEKYQRHLDDIIAVIGDMRRKIMEIELRIDAIEIEGDDN